MPFGLRNAPIHISSSHQQRFQTLLEEFCEVFFFSFFNDILIYSKNLRKNVQYLKEVLHCLLLKQFRAILSKCIFGQQSIDYLGHIVSHLEVASDQNKFKV